MEIRLVGFEMRDMNELSRVVTDSLDSLGMKAAGVLVFDNSPARTLLDGKPYPHAIVISNDHHDLGKVASQININLGVTVIIVNCQDILYPLPTDNWINRGR